MNSQDFQMFQKGFNALNLRLQEITKAIEGLKPQSRIQESVKRSRNTTNAIDYIHTQIDGYGDEQWVVRMLETIKKLLLDPHN